MAIRFTTDIDEIKRRYVVWSAMRAFNARQRARVYDKMAFYSDAGMSVQESLQNMINAETNDGKNKSKIAYILQHWLYEVLNGASLDMAMAPWIPQSDRGVIGAGVRSGNLGTAMRSAIKMADAQKRIRQKIVGGMAQPAMLIIVAIVVLLIFGWSIIPKFAEMSDPTTWTGLGAVLRITANMTNTWLIPITLFIFGVGVLIGWSMPRWTGMSRVSFEDIPPWSLYRAIYGAGFMLSLASLQRSGESLVDSLTLLKKGANPYYAERVNSALRHVLGGDNLGVALRKSGYNFPDQETVTDIRDFSRINALDKYLEKAADEWIERLILKTQAQVAVANKVCVFLVAGILGVLLLGLFSLSSEISNAAAQASMGN